MFKTLGLLAQVPCPESLGCHGTVNCIFSHESQHKVRRTSKGSTETGVGVNTANEGASSARKRRRVEAEPEDSATESQRHLKNRPPRRYLAEPEEDAPISPPPTRRHTHAINVPERMQPKTLTGSSQTSSHTSLSLNPRLLSKAPASHAKRVQIVTIMFDQISQLNQRLQDEPGISGQGLEMSREDMISLVLEEEEHAATKSPSVYENVVKLKIMRFKKMSISDWKSERLKHVAATRMPEVPARQPKTMSTGLSPSQEIAFLSKLLAKQDGLAKHGYVTMKPSAQEVDLAREGMETARGWEQCDRCRTRFQVFEGRRAVDGALTAGGECTYHPGKPRKPVVDGRSDKSSKEAIHACCKERVGTSIGCTVAPSHVFKVTNPARLELLCPFETTPENPAEARKHEAVCFDCEMGYTTYGLEMVRITATSFPEGDIVLDTLVRPQGEILDLNSRYSGVWPEDFAKAVPYTPALSPLTHLSGGKLSVVDSPMTARSLLFALLAPSTPLIGHALNNDLNVARIIHPSIVDTVLLYPHPRGLPIRFGLKMLTKKYLNRDIQTGDGSQGHDSKEDAVAAGDLVKLKIQENWTKMLREGWTAEGTTFSPPT